MCRSHLSADSILLPMKQKERWQKLWKWVKDTPHTKATSGRVSLKISDNHPFIGQSPPPHLTSPFHFVRKIWTLLLLGKGEDYGNWHNSLEEGQERCRVYYGQLYSGSVQCLYHQKVPDFLSNLFHNGINASDKVISWLWIIYAATWEISEKGIWPWNMKL